MDIEELSSKSQEILFGFQGSDFDENQMLYSNQTILNKLNVDKKVSPT